MIDHELYLDKLPYSYFLPSGIDDDNHANRMLDFWKNERYRAVRYFIAKSGHEFLLSLSRQFKKKVELGISIPLKMPFDSCYFEFELVKKSVCVLVANRKLCVVELDPLTPNESSMKRYQLDLDSLIFTDFCGKKATWGNVERNDVFWAFISVWWVVTIMQTPDTFALNHIPARAQLVKGKRRAFAAYSIINFNLNIKKKILRHIFHSLRESPKGHPVSGTWVHYRSDVDCQRKWTEKFAASFLAHDWHEIDSTHQECLTCKTKRSWRKPHQRGDASKGWVNRSGYEVYAK